MEILFQLSTQRASSLGQSAMKLITHHTQACSAQLRVHVVILTRHFNPMCLWLVLQKTLQCANVSLTEVKKKISKTLKKKNRLHFPNSLVCRHFIHYDIFYGTRCTWIHYLGMITNKKCVIFSTWL